MRLLVAEHWHLDAEVVPLGGGMNSETWEVRAGDRRWVLKGAARLPGFDLAVGLAAAARLDAAGVPSGPAEPTESGDLLVGDTALLRFVDGAPLGTDDASWDDDVRALGETLGRAHEVLVDSPAPEAFAWLTTDRDALDVEPWVRPAVVSALEAWRTVDVRSWAVLHGDPAPEAFLRTPCGVGVVDWGSAFHGPCLYDLASALMYVGPDSRDLLVASYLSTAPTTAAEVADGLDGALRLRWAVQAWYFAGRVAADDRTGLEGDPDGNRKGLDDARRGLG